MAGNLSPYHHRPNAPVEAQISAGPAWSPASARQDEQGVPWVRYLSALLRFKWLIIAIVVLGTAAGIGATRFLTPRYEVQATIWISMPNPNARTSGPIRASELLSNPQSWPELLKSFTILDTTVRALKLYVQPAREADWPLLADFATAETFRTGAYVLEIDNARARFSLKSATGDPVDQGALGDSIGRSLGFLWAPPATNFVAGQKIEFGLITPREASLQLRERLATILPRESNVMRLRLTGDQPERVASTLNMINNQFVGTAAALKKRSQVELVKTLSTQLAYAQDELKGAEEALQRFQVETVALPGDQGAPLAAGVRATRDPVMDNFFGQKMQLDSVRHDRQALERTLSDLRAGAVEVHAFHAIPAVAGAQDLREALMEYSALEARLRAAQVTYTDEHRSVLELRRSLDRLRLEVIPGLAQGLIVQTQRRESDLDGRIASATRELRNIPVRAIEEMRLERNVAVRNDLHGTLKSRFEEARLAEASALPDVSVLDSAVAPRYPSVNTAPRIVLMAIAASIGLAVLLALLLDRLDHRFRYPDQIAREMGLEILGAVPNVKRVRPGSHDAEESAQIVESFRSIRLSIHHAIGTHQPVHLTVTSAGSGDGKSFICSNLALSLAEAGYRTLLIDGDIRRGELHSTFGVARRPGLIDYLQGDVALEQILRPTLNDRLTLIPCGTRRHRGPELLASARMAELLASVRQRYDAIIVDSAPLGAGADAFVLGIATGNMALVFRLGETDRQMAEAKLGLLPRIPVTVIGAILNDVPSNGAYRYYSYLYGYSPTDENDRAHPASQVGELTGRA